MRLILTAAALSAATPALALEPADVWLLVNKNVPESRQVADHYIAKRGVPKGNVIVLDLPKGEDVSRADYDARLAGPVRDALKDKKDAAKVLVTTYGVPLRVGGVESTAAEKKELEKVRPDFDAARERLAAMEKGKKPEGELAASRAEFKRLEARLWQLVHQESHACVDSELMLLWWPKYPLERFLPNPLYFQASANYRKGNPPVLMTARLDGPTPEIAKRLVDDAIAAEVKGLAGDVVVDARGLPFDPTNKADGGLAYGGYDESFREAAKLLAAAGLKVVFDDKDAVLPPGSAKNVALYSGWYSLAKFVDACEFVPGAVAWHLASSEAGTLRSPDSPLWCPSLLKKGVAATLGPVAEPYTIGFPKPAEFFGFLVTGEFTLVECYARTIQTCSWMTVLVGDPLYNPYKKTPKLKPADVPPSPKGGGKLVP